uniref:Retrotrans_gag domain-containing protein n=1 Tax=Glossina pallidipes TaxID=7398 RepID=A0A1A9ZNY5_GLOPL
MRQWEASTDVFKTPKSEIDFYLQCFAGGHTCATNCHVDHIHTPKFTQHAHNTTGSITENGSNGHNQQGPPAEASGYSQQLMDMLTQQTEALLSCIQEIGNLKKEKSTEDRQSQLRESGGAENFGLAVSTSTPNQHVPPQAAVLRNASLQTTQRNQQTEEPRTSDESARRRNVDLNRWHLKFDGSGKGLTVESFIFRIERLRQQQQISHEDLFVEFHCLVAGQANKWYWQLIEDREGDSTFDYFSLKAELLNQFKAADSDYEMIREVMERKQQQSESFEDYYAEIHDLTFRLRRKIPETELIKITKSNVKPSLATLIVATKMESVAELKAECKRAEKLLKESRTRPRHINQVEQEVKTSNEARKQTVEAFAPRHEQANNQQLRERRQLQPTTSRADPPRQAAAPTQTAPIHYIRNQLPPVAGNATQNITFCQSPFHLTLCYICGMPTSITSNAFQE